MTALTLALRGLRRSPVHAVLVIVCLAIGLVVNLVAFSVAHALIYGALPGVTDRHAIVRMSLQYTGVSGSENVNGQRVQAGPFSSTDFDVLATTPHASLVRVAAEGHRSVSVRREQTRTPVRAAYVSQDYFETLGSSAYFGRLLTTDDHRADAPPVAVVSHHFWTELAGKATGLGHDVVDINGRPYTIVGVAPPRFSGLQPIDVGQSARSGVQIWLPITRAETPADTAWLEAFGRKASGVTLFSLEDALGPVSAAIEAASGGQRQQARVIARSFGLDPAERPAAAILGILLFMTVPLCVMGIAVANVINLQLARTTEQLRAVVVRLSLGATHQRAMRWLVWETVILVVCATFVGLALTRIVTTLGAALLPFDLTLNPTVMLVALALAAGVVVVTTWAPVRVATRGLTITGLSTATPPHWRLRHGLVVVQVAVSVALVLIATLSARSINAVVNTAPPHADQVWVTQVSLPDDLAATEQHVIIKGLVDGLHSRPELIGVGLSSASGLGDTFRYWRGDDDTADGRPVAGATVTAGWFDAMGVTALSGRLIMPDDTRGVVISEALALRLAPSPAQAVGLLLRVQRNDGATPSPMEVVGVVADPVRHIDGNPRASLYAPATGHERTLVMRQRSAAPLMPSVQRWAREMDPRLQLTPGSSLAHLVAGQAGEGWLVGSIFGGIGALAALLAFLGLVAILAFIVRARSRELAIRGALGARPMDLVRLVLHVSARLVGIGAAAGLLIGVALAIAMRSQLVGVSALDPLSALGTVGLFAVIGAIAAAVPAARAAATNPAVLLRSS